jgi:hypothetical protein
VNPNKESPRHVDVGHATAREEADEEKVDWIRRRNRRTLKKREEYFGLFILSIHYDELF